MDEQLLKRGSIADWTAAGRTEREKKVMSATKGSAVGRWLKKERGRETTYKTSILYRRRVQVEKSIPGPVSRALNGSILSNFHAEQVASAAHRRCRRRKLDAHKNRRHGQFCSYQGISRVSKLNRGRCREDVGIQEQVSELVCWSDV